MSYFIETIGKIAKQEDLCTLEHNVLENTLVLEGLEPFPGYHGDLPTEKKPTTIYLATSKKYSFEKILRLTNHIKKYFKHKFYAAAANICIFNETINCIRIYNLEDFETLPELQSCYVDMGISFKKKKLIKSSAIIKLEKPFVLERLDENIFKDSEDSLIYYLKIPSKLNWKHFAKITKVIKNNIDNNNLDAAMGAFYMKEITDVVRIYAKNMTLEKLNKIRDMYLAEIQKDFEK